MNSSLGIMIPQNFKNKVIDMFGEAGEAWIEELPSIIGSCVKRWELIDLTVSENLSVNLIYFGKSNTYGNVVLKLDGPHPERYTEIKALSLYDGCNICKCYDFDIEKGALLLERLRPGQDLTTLESKQEQLTVAADLICRLPILIEDSSGIPTYEEKLFKAFNRARKEDKVDSKLRAFIDTAEKLYKEIDTTDRIRVLLHGDLHHWNMIYDMNCGWKAIDPQGVIGIKCMEAARFMQNHISMVEDVEKEKLLKDMLTIFSNKFEESERTVCACLFILYILSICWLYEEAVPNFNCIKRCINESELVFSFIESNFY